MLLENKNKESTQKTLMMTRVEQQAAQIATISNSGSKTEPEIVPADSPLKDEEQQLMEVFNGLISENMEELGDINEILNPELLEEESILDNVEELMNDVVPVDTTVVPEVVNAPAIEEIETVEKDLVQPIDDGSKSEAVADVPMEIVTEETEPKLVILLLKMPLQINFTRSTSFRGNRRLPRRTMNRRRPLETKMTIPRICPTIRRFRS